MCSASRAMVIGAACAVLAGCGGALSTGSQPIPALRDVRSARACGGWRVIPSANGSTIFNDLYGVAPSSGSALWAVGSYESKTYTPFLTLTERWNVERWNGAQWSVVSSPNVPGAIYNGLGGIVAVSARDIWAVGESESAPTYATRTLVERWNGTRWSIVASPNVGTAGNGLAGVAYGKGSVLWAVGTQATSSESAGTLVEFHC
jgi:hypothetical protein